MHIYEGRLIAVDANDGFDPAYLLRQTNPASVTKVVVNIKRCSADASTYHRLDSFRLAPKPEGRSRLDRLPWSDFGSMI
jgi:hypothetical protein